MFPGTFVFVCGGSRGMCCSSALASVWWHFFAYYVFLVLGRRFCFCFSQAVFLWVIFWCALLLFNVDFGVLRAVGIQCSFMNYRIILITTR